MTEEVYSNLIPLLHDTDAKGIPQFVKILETKEKFMSSQILEMARTIAKRQSNRIKSKHGTEITKAEEASFSLDIYICAWFSILCMDKARDSKEDFETWMHKMTGGEFLDT